MRIVPLTAEALKATKRKAPTDAQLVKLLNSNDVEVLDDLSAQIRRLAFWELYRRGKITDAGKSIITGK